LRPPLGRAIRIAAILAIAFALVGVIVLPRLLDGEETGGLEFVIPAGASRQIELPTIDSAIAIPTEIVFEPGDVAAISIRNDDSVDNRAGPWVIGAGQTYRIAFDQPGEYEYICTVDPAETVKVTVK
jgi:hypothetical protein